MSRSSHNLPRLCSMNTTCAVSVAIEVAPRSEIETLAFFKCDRIIDAVADKADLAAFPLQFLDVVGLVGGQYLGEIAVHPELLGEPAGRRLVVARDDRDVLDAALAQALDDAADLGP